MFYRTYDYFYQHYRSTNDSRSLNYTYSIFEQLISPRKYRTKTLNKYFRNDFNLLVLEKNALEVVIEQNAIKNIVVVGSAWEHCLRYRPVGLKYVDVTKCNYYIISDLCYKLGMSTVTDEDLNQCTDTIWKKCHDHKLSTNPVDMYKLIGTK
jgi:hypothetical protein